MKVFVAGASGAIGRQLIPQLVDAGHEVVGMTRTPAKVALIEELGASGVVVDALDARAVLAAVTEAQPDAIIHELTAIATLDLRHFDRAFAATNRLRVSGTDHLLAAGKAVGVQRFIAQSYTSWPYARTGSPVKDENAPLDPSPAREMRESMAAIAHVERAVISAEWTEGIVLRYGALYGPGTSMAPGSGEIEMIRRRRFPVIGGGAGVWSFLHVADAAAATVLALEHGRRGIYNIVDDEPAPVAEWLPALASRLGARPPRRVPRFVGRLAAGEAGVIMMTEIRGASNAKARAELGWVPRYPSWRDALGTA